MKNPKFLQQYTYILFVSYRDNQYQLIGDYAPIDIAENIIEILKQKVKTLKL